MAEELPITITIAGRPYRLFAVRKEEESIRKAVKLIEEQISHYEKAYPRSDKQDLLAMVALHFASADVKLEEEVKYLHEQLSPTLVDIDNLLTEALKD